MKEALTVQFVATEQVSGSSLFGLFDTLRAAGRDWEYLVSGAPEEPVFDVSLVGPVAEPIVCGNGLRVVPDHAFDTAPEAELIIVPGLNLSRSDRIERQGHPALPWLEAQRDRGARVVSACTGAVYLAEIGLLDGKEATTHWAFGDLFRWYYPNVRLRLDRGLCFSDAARGVVTSGGTTGWQELALFLIAHYGGAQRAAKAAKVWLLADRGEMQAPYASMIQCSPHADRVIEQAQLWLVDNYASSGPVAGMMEMTGLPATSFARRFRAATGKKPMEYVHALRVEEARQMLETTDMAVAAVGEEVGYDDTASFRRIFKRRTGLTPAEHRRMFGAQRFGRYL